MILTPAKCRRLALNELKKTGERQIKSVCELAHRYDRRVGFATFDGPDVGAVQPATLGQILLRPLRFLAESANGVTHFPREITIIHDGSPYSFVPKLRG